MKIGILTFHEIYNPGAYLQCYATQTLLESMGHQAQVIDYTHPTHKARPWHRLLKRPHAALRSPRAWLDIYAKTRSYRKVQQRLNRTQPFNSSQELTGHKFDAIVIGADIVWDYASPRLGHDPVYFGQHLNCDRLIAWAASMGPCPMDKPVPDYVTCGLPKFSSISVRDLKTQTFAQGILDRDVPVIVDPTFHLDVSRIHLPEPHIVEKNAYLLVYAIPHYITEEAVQAIQQYAKQHRLEIVAVSYRHAWADYNLISVDPFQWMSLIKHARHVFTNTFHGTIFAMKYGTDFVTEYNAAIESKTKHMIDNLGMSARVWFDPKNIGDIWGHAWDVDGVLECMKNGSDEAKCFLKESLA